MVHRLVHERESRIGRLRMVERFYLLSHQSTGSKKRFYGGVIATVESLQSLTVPALRNIKNIEIETDSLDPTAQFSSSPLIAQISLTFSSKKIPTG